MLLFYTKFRRTGKYDLNESYIWLKDIATDIKCMNFVSMVKEICLLEIWSLIISVLETEIGKLFCDLIRGKSRRNLKKFSKWKMYLIKSRMWRESLGFLAMVQDKFYARSFQHSSLSFMKISDFMSYCKTYACRTRIW